MYTLYKFHFLNGITEINKLFDDILIIWPAPVYHIMMMFYSYERWQWLPPSALDPDACAEFTDRSRREVQPSNVKTRGVIERTFGLLKMRFCCLDRSGGELLYSPTKVCKIIVVRWILYNIAIRSGMREQSLPAEEFRQWEQVEIEEAPEQEAPMYRRQKTTALWFTFFSDMQLFSLHIMLHVHELFTLLSPLQGIN